MSDPEVLGTEISIGGVDVSSYALSYRVEDAIDSKFSIARLSFSSEIFSFLDSGKKQAVVIKRGVNRTDETLFQGSVVTFNMDGMVVEVVANDKLWDLSKKSVTKTYYSDDSFAGKFSSIAEDLIETFGGLTASVTDSGTSFVVSKFVCNADFVLERLMRLRDSIKWVVTYDSSSDKVLFQPRGSETVSGVATYGSNIVKPLTWEHDKEELANKLTLIGGAVQVETTVTGQVGVTAGFTLSSVLLGKVPSSVKVYCDSGSSPTTLLVGGMTGSTGGSFDYTVNAQRKLVEWSSSFSPGSSDYVKVDYSYKIPVRIIGEDEASSSVQTVVEGGETHKDIDEVNDGIQRLRDRLSERKEVVKRSQAWVYNLTGLRAGKKLRVVDSFNNVDEFMIIQKVVFQWPQPFDMVAFGGVLSDDDRRVNMNERLRQLEREGSREQDLIVRVLDKPQKVMVKQLYTRVTNAGGDVLRMVWPGNKYVEGFVNTDFESNGTANWDTTNRVLGYA